MTCTTISVFFKLNQRRDRPSGLVSSARSVETKSTFSDCSAGARPKASPVRTVSTIVKPRTRWSRVSSSVSGRSILARKRTSQNASAQPAAPPAADSRRLSVKSWRSNCPRDSAQGEPHRELLRARRSADQEQSRQVAAGDGEDETDDGQHQARRRNQQSVDLRMGADRLRFEHRDAATRILFGIVLRQPRRQHVHRRLRLRDADAVAQPGLDDERQLGRVALEHSRRSVLPSCGGIDEIDSQKSVTRPAVRELVMPTGPTPITVTGTLLTRSVRPSTAGSAANWVRHV